MIKGMLQTKEKETELVWLAKKARNPKDPECGAKLFSNMPGLARFMPDGINRRG